MMLNDGVFVAGLGIALLVLAYLLYRLISCRNDLEWTDLVATRGRLNSYKIGFWIGAVVGSWVVIKQTYMGQLDAAVFGLYMGFLVGAPVAMAAVGTRGSTKPRDDATKPAKPLARNDDPVIE
jgi:hypothetical protein